MRKRVPQVNWQVCENLMNIFHDRELHETLYTWILDPDPPPTLSNLRKIGNDFRNTFCNVSIAVWNCYRALAVLWEGSGGTQSAQHRDSGMMKVIFRNRFHKILESCPNQSDLRSALSSRVLDIFFIGFFFLIGIHITLLQQQCYFRRTRFADRVIIPK